MTRKLRVAGFALFIFLPAAGLEAQDTRSGHTTAPTTNKSARTLTGCLRAGDHNQFKLDAQDGSIWDLRSESMKLALHIGHTIAVTGPVVSQGTENSKTSKPEQGLLTVTSLVVVSEGCQTDIPMRQ